MANLFNISFEDLFLQKIPESDFKNKREDLLRYKSYEDNFNDQINGIISVTVSISDNIANKDFQTLIISSRRRLIDLLDLISLQYSAGAPVDQLAQMWTFIINSAEEYAHFNQEYNQSVETNNYIVPHAALRTEDYWFMALRLTCFGLLSGSSADMPRVMKFLDYINEDMNARDGLLERLVASSTKGRLKPTDSTTRNLPYQKLLEVFDVAIEKRSEIIIKYLNNWYQASQHEPYFDQHGEADFSFYGYWCWEVAATTIILNIDDNSYM